MKIAIPTSDKKTIFGHTGHADYFMVLTIEGKEILESDYRNNPHADNPNHGNIPDHEPGMHNHDHDHNQNHEHNHDHHNHMHHDENAHDRMIESIKDCEYFVVRHVGRRCAPSLKKFGVKPIKVDGNGDVYIEEVLPKVFELIN